jgi:hypothetical protein
MRERVLKICDSFMGQRFDLPPGEHIVEKMAEIKRNI